MLLAAPDTFTSCRSLRQSLHSSYHPIVIVRPPHSLWWSVFPVANLPYSYCLRYISFAAHWPFERERRETAYHTDKSFRTHAAPSNCTRRLPRFVPRYRRWFLPILTPINLPHPTSTACHLPAHRLSYNKAALNSVPTFTGAVHAGHHDSNPHQHGEWSYVYVFGGIRKPWWPSEWPTVCPDVDHHSPQRHSQHLPGLSALQVGCWHEPCRQHMADRSPSWPRRKNWRHHRPCPRREGMGTRSPAC